MKWQTITVHADNRFVRMAAIPGILAGSDKDTDAQVITRIEQRMIMMCDLANNVLKVEVTSGDVAELAAEVCGPRFAKTTGAQIPVDGGNERVI